jgi:tRNA-dihydrouridine synthase C
MRLGYEDDSLAVECAQALVDGGASELVVHARTKAQGYRPPAYWERVQDIRAGIGEHVPVAINGEIWTVEDAIAARTQSGCTSLMLGRGIVANPALALEILGQSPAWSWDAMQPLLRGFWDLVRAHLDHRQQTGRLKQWLKLLRNTYPQAEALYTTIREIHDPLEIRWD